jgi:hypothetical protein
MEKYYYYSLSNSEILRYADSYLENYKLFLPSCSVEGRKGLFGIYPSILPYELCVCFRPPVKWL